MGTDRAALTVLGAAAALLLVLFATTAGGLRSVHLAISTPQHDPVPAQTSTSGSSGGGSQQPLVPAAPSHGLSWLPSWSQLVAIVVLAAIALTVITSLRISLIRRRKIIPGRTRGIAPPPPLDPGPEEGAATLQSLLGEQLSALDVGTPRNAIVAAWVQLEEFAMRHGLEKDPADTPAEFVARALVTYDHDADALQRLADLYREARFSTHEIDEHHRREARACLERLTGSAVSS